MKTQLLDLIFERLQLDPNMPLDQLFEVAHRKYIAELSFNSIGVLLGWELPLGVDALADKILVKGEGGYCFEHNKLYYSVLSDLGCDVRIGLARVVMNSDEDVGLTHRITLLRRDGIDYLVDVGFGPASPRLPMRIDCSNDIEQDGINYRVAHLEGGRYALQAFLKGEYFTYYVFDLSEYSDADCELGHFYSHKHPEANFVNHLVVSRILGHEVRSLRNLLYRRLFVDGFEDQEISSSEDLRAILEEQFKIRRTAEECELLFEKATRAAAEKA